MQGPAPGTMRRTTGSTSDAIIWLTVGSWWVRSRAAAQSTSGAVVGTVVSRSGRWSVGAGSRSQVSSTKAGASPLTSSATLPTSTCPQLASLPASMSQWRGSPGRHSAIALRAAALSAPPMSRQSP